ncbi:MAG: sugar phosphate isomerase/epimerase [Clostridiales bacterium]|jgi:sugar phosphate isomerase/epimerase|nr:sugar phosphate isomerase/epimerase [Clostridiales bacterium]
MNIGIQLIDDHYLAYPDNNLKMISDAGFDSIGFDLRAFCLSLDSMDIPDSNKVACDLYVDIKMIEKKFSSYKSAADRNNLKISQVIAPSASQVADRKTLGRIIVNCIALCGRMGSPYLIVHPFPAGSLNSRQEWRENSDFLLSLVPAAREHQVIICLENQYRDCNGRYLRSVCSDPDTAAYYVDRLNNEAGEELFGFCLNTGNCILFGQSLYETIIKLGNRIRTVRIQDNNGIWKQRLMPYACTRNTLGSSTDWPGFVRGIRQIDFQGTLCFVADGSVISFPSNMRHAVLRFVAEIGRSMAEQIDIERNLSKCRNIILFGAGNMFENYMSSYGDKYPPLFIVDNNSTLWGTSKLGISIKPPDAIKELGGNYGVFICNRFYYEIEKQLTDMGVTHIYRFNDEYRPLNSPK